MHFCTHHNRINCKHVHCKRAKEIGVKILEESGSHDHDATLEDCKRGLPNHVKERMSEVIKSNENVAPKPSCAKTQAEEMNSSTVTRKLINSHLINLRRNKNEHVKLYKNTIAGVNKWAERHCNSDDVEDSCDGNKLIAHEHIASPTKFVILIATKNMLKLLKNNNLQLSLGATHGATWNRWTLHARGVVGVHHYFHPVACVFCF